MTEEELEAITWKQQINLKVVEIERLCAALKAMLYMYGRPLRAEWLNEEAYQEAVLVDAQARAALARYLNTGGGIMDINSDAPDNFASRFPRRCAQLAAKLDKELEIKHLQDVLKSIAECHNPDRCVECSEEAAAVLWRE